MALGPLGGQGKIVESDETFFGRKKGYELRAGTAHKMVVHSLVERGGDVRSTVLDRVNRPDIERIVRENVHRESRLMTDTAPYYRHSKFCTVAYHEIVNHEQYEWTRGDIHTNTLEGYYSIFKRGMKRVCIYQHCSEKHLHRYVAEFDFRYNNRIARGVDDRVSHHERVAAESSGKRLTYKAADN